jgi:hypothetical protein
VIFDVRRFARHQRPAWRTSTVQCFKKEESKTMNLIMQDVTAFKGFAMNKVHRPNCRFTNNLRQAVEILGASGNVTALHVQRMSLPDKEKIVSVVEDDSNADLEALSRFESEGGNAD